MHSSANYLQAYTIREGTSLLLSLQNDKKGASMSESPPETGLGELSRFRAIVIAALRAKQLRRGSKPRVELDDKKHKDTRIAIEEVRRGLISFTEVGQPQNPGVATDLKAGGELSVPVAG